MMERPALATAWLGATLALRALSPVGAIAVLAVAAAAAAAAALGAARRAEASAYRAALAAAAPGVPAATDAFTRMQDNAASFYASLGDVRYGEQQVRTLFGVADKAGLVLGEGDYRSGYDKDGRFHTYQVTLPVKGAYGAVWQFAMQALSSIPFASLDEIGFRRNAVGDAAVEARVQLTVYLADGERR